MKKLRIPLTAVTLMLGIAGAFATQMNHKLDNPFWVLKSSGLDVTDPDNYQTSASPGCNGSNAFCAIQAANSGGEPDISGMLATDLQKIQSGQDPQSDQSQQVFFKP